MTQQPTPPPAGFSDSQRDNPPGGSKPHSRSANRKKRSPRTRAREFALQSLYQHLVGKNDFVAIDRFTRGLQGFHKCDALHYDTLFSGCVEQQSHLDELITPHLDRPLAELSPVEHAILWMGTCEFDRCPETPWRVVLNEYIELAKSFGGTDGYKYVNGVLNQLARQLRAQEVQSSRNHRQP